MICQQLHTITGFECMPLNDDGSLACIFTPFRFGDGAAFAMFAEQAGGQMRFFDDGGVLVHFAGRGVKIDDQRRTKFIRSAGEPYGVTLNEEGVLEIWAQREEAPTAFAKFLSAMAAISAWETEHQGVHVDAVQLVEEVEHLLRAWRPEAEVVVAPEYQGVTGQTYSLDLLVDGQPVVALSPRHASVASALKRLIDIKNLPANAGLNVLVVIDDRYDGPGARRESLLFTPFSAVLPMTRLAENARAPTLAH